MRYIAVIALLLLPQAALCKPVAFPGAWTAYSMADPDRVIAGIALSPTARHAFGVQARHERADDTSLLFATYDRLIYRHNGTRSQANAYIDLGVGAGRGPAGYVGAYADWEDRRWLISWRGRLESIANNALFRQRVRLGFAPVKRSYEQVQPWIIAQLRHVPEADNPINAELVLRLFTGRWLAELGGGPDGGFASFEYRWI